MPLNADAERLIRANLEQVRDGTRPHLVAIGTLTDKQLAALNNERAKRNLPKVESGEVLFLGRHVYESRAGNDGYTIEDIVVQITTAMDGTSRCKSATAIESVTLRDDGYGNKVRDRGVFECTARRPRLELFSVVPGGDTNKPSDARSKRTEPLESGSS